MKIFKKVKKGNKRKIYFLGIKIFSYKKHKKSYETPVSSELEKFVNKNIDLISEKIIFKKWTANAAIFVIPEIFQFIFYKISYENEKYYISLSCEHPTIKKLLNDIICEIAEENRFNIYKDKNSISIEKIVENIEYSDLDAFINASYEKVKNNILSVVDNSMQNNKGALPRAFSNIYSNAIWLRGSGSGSDIDLCNEYINFLETFFQEKEIDSVVDVGCGDWQFSQKIDFGNISYTGYDVAQDIIAINSHLFEKENIKFQAYDGDFSAIKPADLLICKDVLQHLPNEYVFSFIENLYKYKYALICNDIAMPPLQTENSDIKIGEARLIDLRLPPYKLDAVEVFSIKRDSVYQSVLLFKNPNIK